MTWSEEPHALASLYTGNVGQTLDHLNRPEKENTLTTYKEWICITVQLLLFPSAPRKKHRIVFSFI